MSDPENPTLDNEIPTATLEAGIDTGAAKVDVVLIAPHEHAGVLKQAGDSISVNQRQHEWLRTIGKVE